MKLRLIKTKSGIQLLCPNGTIINANKDVLIKLLTSFKLPRQFDGKDGYWNNNVSDMDDVKGETLAYVDYRDDLVVINANTFRDIVMPINYVSAAEYASMHHKGRAIVKRHCKDGKIPGAELHSTGWLIPKDAPYPEDARLGPRDQDTKPAKNNKKE